MPSPLSQDYAFLLKSIKPGIDFTNLSLKSYNRIVIVDDIFNTYPYMEVNIQDPAGLITDNIVTAEGFEFEAKLGSHKAELGGFNTSRWVWGGNTTDDGTISEALNGDTAISFFHKYYANDDEKTRAWENSISNIIKDIMRKDFNITDSKLLKITETTGKQVRYQGGDRNSVFLQRLATRAYSSKFENSPFVAFFNYGGEFYFKAVQDLIKSADVMDTKSFIITADVDSSYARYNIQKFKIIHQGMITKKPVYKTRLFRFNKSLFESETTDIENHLKYESTKKLLINKELKNSKDYYSMNDFGLYRVAKEGEDYKGYRNSLYRPALFPFRMEIVIPYHPKAMSGRKINLDVRSAFTSKGNKSKEFTGEWIIIKNKIYIDGDCAPYNTLTIGRNYTDIDSNHVYKTSVV